MWSWGYWKILGVVLEPGLFAALLLGTLVGLIHARRFYIAGAYCALPLPAWPPLGIGAGVSVLTVCTCTIVY